MKPASSELEEKEQERKSCGWKSMGEQPSATSTATQVPQCPVRLISFKNENSWKMKERD